MEGCYLRCRNSPKHIVACYIVTPVYSLFSMFQHPTERSETSAGEINTRSRCRREVFCTGSPHSAGFGMRTAINRHSP
ncbi:hypothetical protein XELAEV_18002033mg [Xenopus laevis]|uniref:Uncharacterized protein n=1 Tax=Xenopus laevis TaxID=8355 RepID=A0A974GYE0_XENLA|nr:hypothetical protein XELAEV_18002033mg [Xenopus laevis]